MTGYFTTRDGCRIAYRFDGPESAPILLLSNSLGTTMGMWAPQMAGFSRRFRVLRYDTRGHGHSDSPAGSYSLDRLGRDVIELIDGLHLDQVAFCGLSLGGMVGQWLGIREPARIGLLVLANTSSCMGPPESWDARIDTVRSQGMAPIADASVERWFTPEFVQTNIHEVDAVRQMLLGANPAGYAGCCAAIRDMDMRRTVELVSVPTLVIAGTRDAATPRSHSDLLSGAIDGSKLVMVEAAHLSNVEQPAAFLAALMSHLG